MSSQSGGSTLQLGDYLRLAKRRWWAIALGLLVGLSAGYAFTATRGQQYTATASVLVSPVGTDSEVANGRTTGPVNLDTEAQLVRSSVVETKAQALLRTSLSPQDLGEAVKVTVPANTSVLNIAFTADNPEGAQQGAHAFAEAYLAARGDTAKADITARVKALQATVATLSTQQKQLAGQVAALPADSPDRVGRAGEAQQRQRPDRLGQPATGPAADRADRAGQHHQRRAAAGLRLRPARHPRDRQRPAARPAVRPAAGVRDRAGGQAGPALGRPRARIRRAGAGRGADRRADRLQRRAEHAQPAGQRVQRAAQRAGLAGLRSGADHPGRGRIGRAGRQHRRRQPGRLAGSDEPRHRAGLRRPGVQRPADPRPRPGGAGPVRAAARRAQRGQPGAAAGDRTRAAGHPARRRGRADQRGHPGLPDRAGDPAVPALGPVRRHRRAADVLRLTGPDPGPAGPRHRAGGRARHDHARPGAARGPADRPGRHPVDRDGRDAARAGTPGEAGGPGRVCRARDRGDDRRRGGEPRLRPGPVRLVVLGPVRRQP